MAENKLKEKVFVWFFAGAETRDDKFNVFTGSFIRLMKEVMGNEFDFIKGVFYKTNMMNVAWALNNSQRPVDDAGQNQFIRKSFDQLISNGYSPDARLIIVGSSSGTVVAAQTACYLAESNSQKLFFRKPFHLALGASMISTESELFMQLKSYQKKGQIGRLIYEELQDDGDNSNGAGSTTRFRAWMNALGLMFPWFSSRHKSPSFLNTHPVNGHIHRRRSQTLQKAIDFIDVLLVKNKLAGDYYKDLAVKAIEKAKLQDLT